MDLFTRIFRVVRAHTAASEPSDTYEHWRPPEPPPEPLKIRFSLDITPIWSSPMEPIWRR